MDNKDLIAFAKGQWLEGFLTATVVCCVIIIAEKISKK